MTSIIDLHPYLLSVHVLDYQRKGEICLKVEEKPENLKRVCKASKRLFKTLGVGMFSESILHFFLIQIAHLAS